jgi:hypothetical protein
MKKKRFRNLETRNGHVKGAISTFSLDKHIPRLDMTKNVTIFLYPSLVTLRTLLKGTTFTENQIAIINAQSVPHSREKYSILCNQSRK